MTTDAPIAVRKITSVNPATGEILREFEPATETEINTAVNHAQAAQPGWYRLGVRHRIGVLDKFRWLLHEKKAEIARLITSENGKPQVEALITEVLVVLDAARFYSENSYTILRDQTVPHRNLAMKTKSGRLIREPYGLVGIISPWNYPFSIPATETLAALVAGNAVILKPSEFTSSIALELAALLLGAGVPKHVFQVVVGDGNTGSALVNADIDKLVFTGSVTTGRRIAQTTAARLLPVVLELGGKDPMLVLNDADIDVASSGAVWGAFMNAGQACLSVERCYVHRNLYKPFSEVCTRKAAQLRIGNGMDPETDLGPLIHERQLRNVEAHVEDARLHGARVLTGGERRRDLGPNFYAPTVLADVTHEMRIMREETFGPVLPIMPFDTDDEAVRLANDSDYGLSASVWTRDRTRGEDLARRIHAGTVMVNDAVSCFGVSEAPHGGVKASGIGRTHGIFGLEEMARIKYLDSDRLPAMKKVWWYGYGESFTRQIEGFVDLMFARSFGKRLHGALRSAGVLTRKGKI
ncbi:MAG TPA: aldehyde dehydrogenase family protein [Terriglobales bacterium]|jgi:acyl-CoA reductase-like NAD-dependent aldehyde dehydrogenase|nr:aldehyde dehydrogenase family protein [Terriglobales bacterium]